MPLTAKGEKILHNMEKEYHGEKEGKRVFYASKNKGTISGVDALDKIVAECDRLEKRFDEMEMKRGHLKAKAIPIS